MTVAEDLLAAAIDARLAAAEEGSAGLEVSRELAIEASDLLRRSWPGPWPAPLVFRTARTLQVTGQYRRAVGLLREALKNGPLPLALSARYESLRAIFATERLRFEDVLCPAARAAESCEALGDLLGMGLNLRLHGRALVRTGRVPLGVKELRQAVALLAQTEQPLDLLQAELELAHGLARAGDLEGAERLASSASQRVPAGAHWMVLGLARSVALHYRLECSRHALREGSLQAVARDTLAVAEESLEVSFRLQLEAVSLFGAALAAGGAVGQARRVFDYLCSVEDFPMPRGAPERSRAIGCAPLSGLWGLAILSLIDGDREAACARLALIREQTAEIHLIGFTASPSQESRRGCLDLMCAMLSETSLPVSGAGAPWVNTLLSSPGFWRHPMEDALESPKDIRRNLVGAKQIITAQSPTLPIDHVLPDVRELASVTGLMIDEGLIGLGDPELFSQIESSKSLVLLAELMGRDLWHETRMISGARITGGADPFAVAAFLRTLPGTAMLQFFVSERSTTIWMLSGAPEGCVTMRLDGFGRHELRALIETGWHLPLAVAQDPNTGDSQRAEALALMNATLDRLHEVLFETESGHGMSVSKVLDRVACESLIFVPHDRLHEVPMHALSDRQGIYLGDKYDVSYLPAARLVMRSLLHRRRAWGDRVVVVNDPDGTLPNAQSELAAIRAAFPQAEVWGPGTTWSRDVLAVLSGTDVLHFSCHAFFDRSDWQESGLLLSEGDILTIRQLLASDSPVRERPYGEHLRSVFLAACDTAVHARSSHDEVMSLATAFLACGAPAVIGSLWPAYDAAAVSVVKEFYRRVRKPGATAARGLREAQRAARDDYDHPLYWASFQLIGC